MDYIVFESNEELGRAAAQEGAEIIRRAISERGSAGIILATGMSQVIMLSHLVTYSDIDWSAVTAFHLDEYVGLPESHKASFRRYLKERFVDQVPDLKAFHFVDGENPDPAAECRRLAAEIGRHTIDVAFVGIGENGHLAFNDPPADFETREPYLVVNLDRACREQQLGEGWFRSIDDVPPQAISMSVSQILKSNRIICSVPDKRKAAAVQCTIEGPVTPNCPASALQQHEGCRIYLDRGSASELTQA